MMDLVQPPERSDSVQQVMREVGAEVVEDERGEERERERQKRKRRESCGRGFHPRGRQALEPESEGKAPGRQIEYVGREERPHEGQGSKAERGDTLEGDDGDNRGEEHESFHVSNPPWDPRRRCDPGGVAMTTFEGVDSLRGDGGATGNRVAMR
jgi:hypothetical protein